MIKVLMLLWVSAGPIQGLTTQVMTLDECEAVKEKATYEIRVVCIPMDKGKGDRE